MLSILCSGTVSKGEFVTSIHSFINCFVNASSCVYMIVITVNMCDYNQWSHITLFTLGSSADSHRIVYGSRVVNCSYSYDQNVCINIMQMLCRIFINLSQL